MLRVLHVFHGMGCGGAENMIMNIYRNIDRNEIQFDFLVHTEEKCFFDDEIEELGGRIFRVPYYKVHNEKTYIQSLKSIFNEHPEVTIVHGHLGSCAHIYLKVAKEYGCFTIAHSHNTKPKISVKSILYRFFTYKTRKIADYFMACGMDAGYYRFGKKITSDKVKFCVLNNAIKTDRYIYNEKIRDIKRKELGIRDGEILLGHVGRFSYQKNHEFLINMFSRISDNRFKLILIGDGELKETFEHNVKNMSMEDRIIFTGIRSDVPELLQAIDCFVFPSHFEGLPVTLIEAQAAGLPCIVSDKITREVEITNLVTFVSIENTENQWAKIIENTNYTLRNNMKENVINSGYDIFSTSKWIQSFYIEKTEMAGK